MWFGSLSWLVASSHKFFPFYFTPRAMRSTTKITNKLQGQIFNLGFILGLFPYIPVVWQCSTICAYKNGLWQCDCLAVHRCRLVSGLRHAVLFSGTRSDVPDMAQWNNRLDLVACPFDCVYCNSLLHDSPLPLPSHSYHSVRNAASTIFISFLRLLKHKANAFLLFNRFFPTLEGKDTITDFYVKPYNRCQPYLIGILIGYVIFKMKDKKIRIHWVRVYCLCCCWLWIFEGYFTLPKKENLNSIQRIVLSLSRRKHRIIACASQLRVNIPQVTPLWYDRIQSFS